MKYIPLDAVVAKIEKLISNGQTKLKESEECNDYESYVAWAERIATCINVLSLLNALEVKEVDLDMEINLYVRNLHRVPNFEELNKFARHFFELGMRVSNPITAEDRGTAEEIIINLKRVEQDYHINLTKEIEWVRNQVKKGELSHDR